MREARHPRAPWPTLRRCLSAAGLALLIAGFQAMAAGGAETARVSGGWHAVPGCPECQCADGSAVDLIERVADPTRVVLYFEGGGACFNSATCAFDSPRRTYVTSDLVTPATLAQRGGIFDLEHPENPLADFSFVHVPYCTGDGHLGTATTIYSDDLVVQHKGFVNATFALEHLLARFPDVTELVVAGSSAGAIPVPLIAGLAADVLPGAHIVSLADSAGAYPDVPVLNALIGHLWGTAAAIPDWPETADVRLDEWSIPGLYVYAGRHAPRIAFARFDHAFDEAQVFYAELVGLEVDELVVLIEEIETAIEAAGVNVASFVAPGNGHTILGSEAFYELEVESVRFVDWVDALVKGGVPADVRCVQCRPAS